MTGQADNLVAKYTSSPSHSCYTEGRTSRPLNTAGFKHGVEALQKGATRGFLPTTALLNVEDEVIALPEVQEQCTHF
jgi:hypothetical protein